MPGWTGCDGGESLHSSLALDPCCCSCSPCLGAYILCKCVKSCFLFILLPLQALISQPGHVHTARLISKVRGSGHIFWNFHFAAHDLRKVSFVFFFSLAFQIAALWHTRLNMPSRVTLLHRGCNVRLLEDSILTAELSHGFGFKSRWLISQRVRTGPLLQDQNFPPEPFLWHFQWRDWRLFILFAWYRNCTYILELWI